VSALLTELKEDCIAEYCKQASQWAGPGFKILSLAHTWPNDRAPDPNLTRPEKARAAQTAQTIQLEGLSQFDLKISILLT